MTQKCIMFVDDDTNVLEGLQRMLRCMRKQWTMEFVGSGSDALTLLAQRHFDVLVSDIRMPGMGGAQLLNEVQLRAPGVVRIALSGYSDRETTMSSLGATHQYLSKPCDAETLKAAVCRAVELKNLFQDEPSIKPLISRLHALPSLPSLYLAIVEELRSPSVTLRRVGKIVASDPGMTAKILQLVNSAFFGIGQRILSAEHAVQLLGLDLIQALVLSVHIFDQVDIPGGVDPDKMWPHSMQVGSLAKQIAQSAGADENTCNAAMVGGLLHDVGQLILLGNVAQEYGSLVQRAQREQATLFELERIEFGATHAEIGGYLLGLWGLPDAIVEAVTFHHGPGIPDPPTLFTARIAVCAANYLLHPEESEEDNTTHAPEALHAFAGEFPGWRALATH